MSTTCKNDLVRCCFLGYLAIAAERMNNNFKSDEKFKCKIEITNCIRKEYIIQLGFYIDYAKGFTREFHEKEKKTVKQIASDCVSG